MEIHAYSELYLQSAQNILGHAVDFAVMTLGIDPDAFGTAFAVSPCSKQFALGNPSYVAGRNGCELAREVLDAVHYPYENADDAMYLDKSPEYWAGWALAYYQWFSDLSFMEILSAVPLGTIISMYEPYHEMDILQFVSTMHDLLKRTHPQTRLRQKRELSNLSQQELADESGVPLRQIQLFEQRQRDINKTSSITLYKLSKCLNCSMDELLERLD